MLSDEVETIVLQLSLIAQQNTESVCPDKVDNAMFCSKSHNFNVLSSDAETAILPFLVIAQFVTTC